jgi:hypothetical protein
LRTKEAGVVTQVLATEVKNKHSAEMLARPHVCGIGTARTASGDWVIEVHVEAGSSVQLEIPENLDGVPVHVIADGPYHAWPSTTQH